ncbi:unnamed protein product [marine sediment metagenome]|uniref:Uncharacterized protein n=1 Tax=marine sediment metagenome TaxID=412755 RepID=X1AS87_9ZZZZ
MKHDKSFSLFEMIKVQKDLWEVFTTDYFKDGTYSIKDISQHATEREAQEQKQINKDKNENK